MRLLALVGALAVSAVIAVLAWLNTRDLSEIAEPETYTEHDGTSWSYTTTGPDWMAGVVHGCFRCGRMHTIGVPCPSNTTTAN